MNKLLAVLVCILLTACGGDNPEVVQPGLLSTQEKTVLKQALDEFDVNSVSCCTIQTNGVRTKLGL